MKRTLSLIIIMCWVFAACQETPEELVVQNKADESYLEMINEDGKEDVGNNIEESTVLVEFENNWVDTVYFKSENITIDIDANIITPTASNMPIYEIFMEKITQEQVDGFLSIFGDVNFRIESSVYDKAYYEQQILNLQEYLAITLPNKEVDEETRERLKKEAEQGIENFKELMENAPENLESVQPVFTNEYLIFASEQMIASGEETISEDEKISAEEEYTRTNTESIEVTWDFENETCMFSAVRSDLPFQNGISFYKFSLNSEYKEEIIERNSSNIEALSTKYIQAEKQAIDIVKNKLGIDYFSIAYSAKNGESGYIFYFTRNVEGINETFSSNIQTFLDRYDEPWNYEYLYIIIDDSGAREMRLNSSLSEIGECISTDVSLLPFNEIQEIAIEQLEIGNIDFVNTKLDFDRTEMPSIEINVNIEEVQLGYMRVKLPNSDNRYALIPVWDFFGSYEFSGYGEKPDVVFTSDELESVSSVRHSYLTINAIDGSTIDRSLGY